MLVIMAFFFTVMEIDLRTMLSYQKRLQVQFKLRLPYDESFMDRAVFGKDKEVSCNRNAQNIAKVVSMNLLLMLQAARKPMIKNIFNPEDVFLRMIRIFFIYMVVLFVILIVLSSYFVICQ